jgi:PPK2 family polyphosphate:nucleotide phosphotransferase
MEMKTDKYLIKPGSKVKLADFNPADTQDYDKTSGLAEIEKLRTDLNPLQQLLYASCKYGMLIVLQGMDTSGKDGVCRHVVSAFNPQGVQITAFKVPTDEERAHDFMWRIHKAAPRRGIVGIFNRSQYEDVLIVRVENLVTEAVWRQRYEIINDFESSLVENNILVLKFYLHLSKDEQKRRLEARLADPTEYWKFKAADLSSRAKWDDYMLAYEDVLNECSTKQAPWYLIPADKKWYRDLLISHILRERLGALKMEWPPLEEAAKGVKIV